MEDIFGRTIPELCDEEAKPVPAAFEEHVRRMLAEDFAEPHRHSADQLREVVASGKTKVIRPDHLIVLDMTTRPLFVLVAESKYKRRLSKRDLAQAVRYRDLLLAEQARLYYPEGCLASQQVRAYAEAERVKLCEVSVSVSDQHIDGSRPTQA